MSGSAAPASSPAPTSAPPAGCTLAVPVEEALLAVEDAAQIWGADWERDGEGGRLYLPVTAGIRRGEIEGQVRVERNGDGSRLRFEIARAEYRVHVAALVVLLIGLLGYLLNLAYLLAERRMLAWHRGWRAATPQ